MQKITILATSLILGFSLLSCSNNRTSIPETKDPETNQNEEIKPNENDNITPEETDKEDPNRELLPHEIVNEAIKKYEDTPNHYAVANGSVDAGLDIQTVDTVSGRVNNRYFMESISIGKFVTVAKRFYEDDSKITEYTGKNVDKINLTASWKSQMDFETKDDFVNKWGKKIQESSIYVINKDTVLTENKSTTADNNTLIKLTLDPELATAKYSKQIISMSNLKQPPKFYELEISYLLNQNNELISREVKENYDIKKLGTHNSTGILKETYHIGNFKIPELDTDCNFYNK